MVLTNQERFGKGMELLRAGLAPFMEREFQTAVDAGTVRIDVNQHPIGTPPRIAINMWISLR
jgi:hypothetical protein